MSKPNREALSILSELGVTVVPKNVAPRPGETRSVGTIQKIIRRHGKEHCRLVLMLIMQSENNRAALDEASIGAVSDLVEEFRRIYPAKAENGISELFDFLDRTPIAQIRLLFAGEHCKDRRATLKGMLRERMLRAFGIPQLDWLDDRRQA